jgi:hypothetical protein
VPLRVSARSPIDVLCRARYFENTAALLTLLFVQGFLLVCHGTGALTLHVPPLPFIPCYTACSAIGTLLLVPCWWFDRWLRALLGPLLPLPGLLHWWSAPPTAALRLRVILTGSAFLAVTTLALLAWLFQQQQIGSVVAALPWAGGILVGLYLLAEALYWGLRALFLRRPPFCSTRLDARDDRGDAS